tara:strand:- start:70 stop:702 length:633 start_codon:yes stop_codon:yes gene_type:complete
MDIVYVSKEEIVQELKDKGFAVLPNYWDIEKCAQAKKELLQVPSHVFEIGQGGDLRFQHANKYLLTANSFLKDSFILEVAQSYSDCNVPHRIVAGIVQHKEGETIDSGGSWHVDSEQKAQFKSIIYLEDVNSDNGPFVIVQKSRDLVNELQKHSNLRISEDLVREHVNPEDIIEMTAPAGTCILADTTYLHRGKQIESGVRYTYTTYFYE